MSIVANQRNLKLCLETQFSDAICAVLFIFLMSTSTIAQTTEDTPEITGDTDGKNYFYEWKCTSSVGFDTINLLNIAPLGTHPPSIWKDSIYVDPFDPTAGGRPVIFFTWGKHAPGPGEPVFTEAYAEFDTLKNRWKIVTYLDDHVAGGGVSSHDGSLSNYIFNEYRAAGWGPFANKPGNQSKILGVANEHAHLLGPDAERETIGYPMVGAGNLGIRSVQSTLQHPDGDFNTRTCLHMNPSLFTDRTGRPSMVVSLWTAGPPPTGRKACTLPDGRKLPADGNYFYHYEGAELGWQLDIQRGIIGVPGNDALNSIAGTPNAFLATQYGSRGAPTEYRIINSTQYGTGTSPAKLQMINSDTNVATDMLSCTGQDLHFAEATGSDQKVYFLGDYFSNGQVPFVHDIFVAYKMTR